ncbi:hypothetical protein [Kribbella sp. NPDC023855]|uniref:hypothetical protein n=1 Tax=Kribbella sp. NPDC023855 TaxID=3154698 RepID=UPI0033DA0DFA
MGLAGAGSGGGEEEQSRTFELAADATGVGAELLDELLGESVQGSLCFLADKETQDRKNRQKAGLARPQRRSARSRVPNS